MAHKTENNIKRIYQESHSKEDWYNLLLDDYKEYVEEQFLNKRCKECANIADSFDRIMYFYHKELEGESELEDREAPKVLYDKLGWNSENYDVINSFYTIFANSLVAYSNSTKAVTFKEIREELKDNQQLKKIIRGWDFKLFDLGDCTALKIAMSGSLKDIGKCRYSKKAIKNDNLQRIIAKKYFFGDNYDIKLSEKLLELASLTHSFANFMPCPGQKYNTTKGLNPEIRDDFNLMINKIQSCIDKRTFLENRDGNISLENLLNWQRWFIDNRTKYFLDEYYDVENGRLIAKRMFKDQSFNNPIPIEAPEIIEYLDNILKRIKNRADQLSNELAFSVV